MEALTLGGKKGGEVTLLCSRYHYLFMPKASGVCSEIIIPLSFLTLLKPDDTCVKINVET